LAVIYRERPDWLAYYRAYLLGAVFFLLSANTGNAGGGFVILLVIAGYAALARQRSEFLIEEDKIVIREGLIARNSNEIRIKHIRALSVRQNVLERLLGIGTLAAVTASHGESTAIFKGIRDPEAVKELVSKRLV